ncbi:hypothetical protein [Halomonas sp.]|uniref:hypothetical protein n=1 Tax=Halomonas sp. TaxID=1486246 RepID=UPI0035627E1D
MLTLIASNLGTGRARERSACLLDQYLNRIGHQTWGGYLSREGLNELLDELRTGANRNTAVQIIHEHAHRFETIALIGSRKRFQDGLVSVGKVLQRRQHTTPEMIRVIRKIAESAALWHDAGKTFRDFQAMIRGNYQGKHALRHYTASYFAYHAWLQSGCQSLDELDFTIRSADSWMIPGHQLPAELTAAIILTHHCKTGDGDEHTLKLDARRFGEGITNRRSEILDLEALGDAWHASCRQRHQQLEQLAGSLPQEAQGLAFYVARATMMLADHAESSWEQKSDYKGARPDSPLPGVPYAKSGPFIPLPDHLFGVMRFCGSATGAFLTHAWPRLARRPEALKTRPRGPFTWQSVAETAIGSLVPKEGDGFFGVVIAETGTGKTQGGYRIMSALSGGHPRYTLGLGYGALAIQSGIEYRRELGLTQEETAIFVGRRHAGSQRQQEAALPTSADGPEALSLEMEHSIGAVDHQLPDAVRLSVTDHQKRLLSTPIISMTIDHIMSAMEADRGTFVTAALRVATADLLIDEIDSFSIGDLHAIGRLLYICGLYARKVVISSATTTPEIAEGLYRAYLAGYVQYQALSGKGRLLIGMFSNRGEQASVGECQDPTGFCDHYTRFVEPISRELLTLPGHRRKLTRFDADATGTREAFFEAIFAEVMQLADTHGAPLFSLPAYATGFVRFNLVKQAQAFTAWLVRHHERLEVETGWRIRANYYGASLDSSARQLIEKRLVELLNRKTEHFTGTQELARLLQEDDQRPTLFLLVTTPLIEVGRDYDFDFAIVEPSSDMSIIQSAGRVLRHRYSLAPKAANISLMPCSLRALEGRRKGRFLYGYPGPGVEQIDPVTEESWRLPLKQPASELFGLDLYQAGVHAGHRIHLAQSPADAKEREVQRAVLLSEEELSLSAFCRHPNPFRDRFFDAIRFRGKGDVEPRYEYRHDGSAFLLSTDEECRVEPEVVGELVNSPLFLIRPRLMKNTRLHSSSVLDWGFAYAPAMGVLDSLAMQLLTDTP